MLHAARNALFRFLRDRAGNVAIISALCLPIVLGAFGIGAEAASWIASKRALQNAADAAAVAAATNAGSSYADEAKGVAAQYGFKDGTNNVTVTASNSATCPAGAGTGPCYSVTVSYATPLLLAQVVGYGGDTTLSGSPAKIISATAVAVQGPTQRDYCLVALAKSGADPALTTDGAPNADLSGCNIASNTGATCNGHNLQADNGDAHTQNNGCGIQQHSNMGTVDDQYAAMASAIPSTDPCPSRYPSRNYATKPVKKGDPPLPAENTPSGTLSGGGVQTICGDFVPSGDLTITQDTTIVIRNGSLDANGYTIQTTNGAHATFVFAGGAANPNGAGYTHTVTGGGTLDIQAPESGDWKGMTLYQDPALTSGVNIAAAGNSPTWNMTGAVYFPRANVTLSGAVNKSANGKSCFIMVADTVRINGTGSILAHGQCDGIVPPPTGLVPGRGKLVQ
jgi:Flp pilus assembly protein TadG